jgi:hypothetical protein
VRERHGQDPAAHSEEAADTDEARQRIGDGHERGVERRRDAPDCAEADETRKAERVEHGHERRTRDCAEAEDRAHPNRRRCHGPHALLPGREGLDLLLGDLGASDATLFLKTHSLRGRNVCLGGRSDPRRRPHELPIACDEGTAHDLVLEVDEVPPLLANREQELGDVVRVERRRLRRQA